MNEQLKARIIELLSPYPKGLTVQAIQRRLMHLDLNFTELKLLGKCNELVDQCELETYTKKAFGRKDVYFKVAKKLPLESLELPIDEVPAGKKLDNALKGVAKCLHEDVLHDAVPMCSLCKNKINSLERDLKNALEYSRKLENEIDSLKKELEQIELFGHLQNTKCTEDRARKLSIISAILEL